MADFTLRLPDELDELVTADGQAGGRSKHRQVLRVLEERYGLYEPSELPVSVQRLLDERREKQEAA
jgi:hypothetical protein